jgi:hypothetical protein
LGTPDFKSGAYDQFRHPGRRPNVSYSPGLSADGGKRSGPL